MYLVRVYFLIIAFVAFVPLVRAGWFTADPFVSVSECKYKDEADVKQKQNYTRAMVWDCFLGMGDSNKNGVLTLKEMQDARKTHLTLWERSISPYAQKIIDRCSPKKHMHQLTKQTFMASTNPDCVGNLKDICRVRGVCVRELDPK